jgi:DNA replication protein DnaC
MLTRLKLTAIRDQLDSLVDEAGRKELTIRELATGRFTANGEAVLLLGPPGVGNTHLAVALGREAIVAGYTALFAPAPGLVAQLAKAQV